MTKHHPVPTPLDTGAGVQRAACAASVIDRAAGGDLSATVVGQSQYSPDPWLDSNRGLEAEAARQIPQRGAARAPAAKLFPDRGVAHSV